jgi:hypothetical protein
MEDKMKTQEMMNNEDLKSKRKHNLAENIGQAMGLILCMCISAIIIALTVKFIMWIL